MSTMFRQTVARPVSSANRLLASNGTRSFSALAPRMAAGDTGSPRTTGGAQQGDSFTRREQAQENVYIHEKEREKLHALKKKLTEQRDHLNQLEEHIDQLTRNQGGEQN